MTTMPPATDRGAHPAAYVFSGLTAAVALAVFAGWTLRIEALTRFVPGYAAMNPVTACCLLAAAASLMLLAPARPGRIRWRIGQILAGVVVAVGSARLLGYIAGWPLGIDRWLFAQELTNPLDPPNRIAIRTALNLAGAGLAVLLLNVRTARGRRPTEALCAISVVIAALALIGYSYGLFVYYRAPNFVPMSLPGALAFLMLATGTLLARPQEGAMRMIMSNTSAGLLARLLLPLGLLLPVLLGGLRFVGEDAGWYTSRVGVALFATAFIVLFLASVFWTTRVLYRADLNRLAAEERVRQLNSELEQRVVERTAELNSLNGELRQANTAKDHFLAALSHELRTPLTPVLMSAAALERDPDVPPVLREQLGMMRRNVELEARLIDDLLDLTRITRGKLELHLGPTNVHILLEQTGEIVRSAARTKGVELRFVLNAAEHTVSGDAARLHQVFWNVIKNGIKFTPRGGTVTVETTNPQPALLRLEVTDTGVGIEESLLPEVFTAFVQGRPGTAANSGGLGLGMSISKSIVDLHGGTIAAASRGPGMGARFAIELEATLAILPERAAQPPTVVSPPARNTYRLLLVEDHQPTQDVLARLLRKHGHEVATASTVEAALAIASQGHFDLVISDIGLPDGNGIDLMVQLTRDYGLRGIALSGYGMDEDFARTKDAGFIAHLVKPIDFERLRHVLEQVARAA